jgi:dTDP-4-amino-4,6-dideoxygalactose transaminase
MTGIPLTRPSPPRLSEASGLLRGIEESGIFSNFGPVNTRFEAAMRERMFGGEGQCMTVCNATIGLMMAIQNAIQVRPTRTRYALMPSFTFAAAAQAAQWCGLTPLFCDIDPNDWAASAAAEESLLRRYGDAIAVIVPYATFGYAIDLQRYADITARHGVPVVVDAAASLGTRQADGRGFGAGFQGTIVFSMHCTKSFATGEGGLVYSGSPATMRNLRTMCNFGFGRPRTATMLGLNGKLSEVGALLGQLRLAEYDQVMDRRAALVQLYRAALPELTFQPEQPQRQAHQFASALLPPDLQGHRAAIQVAMAVEGIGTASYFSPHLAEQDYFVETAVSGPLPVTRSVASRIISLPLFDTMTEQQVVTVTNALLRQMLLTRGTLVAAQPRARRRPRVLALSPKDCAHPAA